MIDLKPYYDNVMATEAEVQRIASEIDAQFRLETEEGKAKALEMQPQLIDAQVKHAEAVSLYESMQRSNRPNDIAKNFVPVSTTTPEGEEGGQPSVIKRSEYDKLSLVNRAKFIKSGGSVED
jgi:hypothetical protein